MLSYISLLCGRYLHHSHSVNGLEGLVVAATVLPKSLKFWAPPRDGILLQVVLSLMVDHVLSLDILNNLCAACCRMLFVFDFLQRVAELSLVLLIFL